MKVRCIIKLDIAFYCSYQYPWSCTYNIRILPDWFEPGCNISWSIHRRILNIVNNLFHFIYFHFRMMKVLVQFVCVFIIMVCIFGLDNDHIYLNCRRACFADYNNCMKFVESPLLQFKNCLENRHDCLRDCYKLNDEVGESELAEADKVIFEDLFQ